MPDPENITETSLSRRQLIAAGLAGLSTAALGGGTLERVLAQPAAPFRIDVHHHLFPPTLVEALTKANLGTRPASDWTPQRSIEDMDKAGIAVAMTSITTPGVSFLDVATARTVARECNEYAAKLRETNKGRFGIFLALPMQDADGALAEIAYGLDTLKADGIAMLTSYGDVWLGHPKFEPIFEELNRRKAIVYTHPTSANCCRNIQPAFPDSIIEWGTDTTRAIAGIVFSGAAHKYRDIKFIFSHAGGTMPFLAERFTLAPQTLLGPEQKKALTAAVPEGVAAELQRFYYDTAQATHPAPLTALTKLIPISQILYGTDYPYRRGAENVQGLAAFGFTPSDLAAIEFGNAARIMPKYA